MMYCELTAKSAMSRIVVVKKKKLPLWLYSYSSLLISRVSGLFLLVGVKEDNPDDKKQRKEKQTTIPEVIRTVISVYKQGL